MSLPAGITTATLTVGVPVTFGGGPVRSTVSIVPSAFLIHTETGTPLVDFIEELETAEGVAGQFTLPHTDQDGFQDENGNAYKNWYYTASIQYATNKGNKPPRTKVFQLVTGQTSVDVDKLPGGAPVLPYTGPVAGITSVNGQTGTVVVDELTDAGVAAFVEGAGPTATALDERYTRELAPISAISYDPTTGDVTSITEGGITTTYTYNPDGTLNTETRLGKTRTRTYDGNGRLTGATVA